MKLSSAFAAATLVAGASAIDIYRDAYFAAQLPTADITDSEKDYFAMCVLDSYNALPNSKATLDSVSVFFTGPLEDVDPDAAAALANHAGDRKLCANCWPFHYPGISFGSGYHGVGTCDYCNPYDDDDPFLSEERNAAIQRTIIEDDEPKHTEWAAAICNCLGNGPFETLKSAHDCAIWVPKNAANGYIVDGDEEEEDVEQENDVVRHGMFHGTFQSPTELSADAKAALGQIIVDSYNEIHAADTGFTMKSIEIGSGEHMGDSTNSKLPWYMQGSSWTYDMTTTVECLFCTDDCYEDDDMVDCNEPKTDDMIPQPHHLKLAEDICKKLNDSSLTELQKVHDCIMWYDDKTTKNVEEEDDMEMTTTTTQLLRGVAEAFHLANN